MAMSYEQVVLDVLRRHCGIEGKITLDSTLQGDLGLDSVAMLTLMVELENHFQRELEGPADQPPQNVREVVRMVTRSVERGVGSRTPLPMSAPVEPDDRGGERPA